MTFEIFAVNLDPLVVAKAREFQLNRSQICRDALKKAVRRMELGTINLDELGESV